MDFGRRVAARCLRYDGHGFCPHHPGALEAQRGCANLSLLAWCRRRITQHITGGETMQQTASPTPRPACVALCFGQPLRSDQGQISVHNHNHNSNNAAKIHSSRAPSPGPKTSVPLEPRPTTRRHPPHPPCLLAGVKDNILAPKVARWGESVLQTSRVAWEWGKWRMG